ncbi:MAG TPA: hypothetical protein VL992_18090 [Tepidisphaeraceae bacterium]|nr:hypothetical protein [Tepidisphaeraceae bacterium]
MRRYTFIIVAGLFLTGCAASRPAAPVAAVEAPQYASATTTALVFDPVIAGGVAGPAISRDNRGVAAYVGLTDGSIEVYDVQTDDDQQYYNWPSTYERRVISDKVGTVYH